MRVVYFYTKDDDGLIEASNIFLDRKEAISEMMTKVREMLDSNGISPNRDDSAAMEAMNNLGLDYYKLHTATIPFDDIQKRVNELAGAHDLINEVLKEPGVTIPADEAEARIRRIMDNELGVYADVLILSAYRDLMCWLLGHTDHDTSQFLKNMSSVSKIYQEMTGVNPARLN